MLVTQMEPISTSYSQGTTRTGSDTHGVSLVLDIGKPTSSLNDRLVLQSMVALMLIVVSPTSKPVTSNRSGKGASGDRSGDETLVATPTFDGSCAPTVVITRRISTRPTLASPEYSTNAIALTGKLMV